MNKWYKNCQSLSPNLTYFYNNLLIADLTLFIFFFNLIIYEISSFIRSDPPETLFNVYLNLVYIQSVIYSTDQSYKLIVFSNSFYYGLSLLDNFDTIFFSINSYFYP